MKNWADHCSSDEESFDGITEQLEAQKLEEEVQAEDEAAGAADAEGAPVEEVHGGPPAPRTYDFPTSPPFTAFVGNLAYSVKEPHDLEEAMAKCASEKFGKDFKFLGARVAYGRDGKHLGFGYLEVETLDDLKQLMELNNDGEATLAGRRIQLDTANSKRNSRGGRNNRQRKGNHGGNSNIDGSKFRGGKFNRGRGDGPPAQRTSLKLAPRSKQADESEGGGPADIFGGAKPRDGQAWEERRKSENSDRNNNRSSQGGRGRGGRGNRGDHKDGKRGSNGKRQSQQQKQISPEERAAAAAAKAATQAAAPAPASAKPAAPTNKFALLMDSDSE
mmetsp:Transcript_80181/g.232818  ORF Transcript_80181/g.232818 Transcript_80181/m.232818 type:complete len:332 (+) Transcript_80181:223-1218(+)